MKILGIESSCDETGVAIVENGTTLLGNALASSMDIHAQFGGVVPEIAARSHIESFIPVIEQAFTDSGLGWSDIDGIAITTGAGLLGSLLIGILTARTLAIIKNKPLYSINHVEAHIYANFLVEPVPSFPVLSLIVSGGHSQLVYFKDHHDYQVLGQTKDDAVGEAFDKVAKILGLSYPGGPSIAKAALSGDPYAYDLPKAKVDKIYDFSFSGLKTAVLRVAQQVVGGDFRTPSTELPNRLSEKQKLDIAASFQRIAIETLVEKTMLAYKEYQPKTVVIAGGVAANQELRRQLTDALPLNITYAPPALCTDNGAMVAALGYFKVKSNKEKSDPYKLEACPNLKM
ncbi:MAG TPA: tRNA (adenosine(37)-N6)-threonylcarbamoyltransferase complex transferase subunit TsaD [Patescibacteria group bacterium]|jgi:N6-L-threonylcarbamoyladenine synthase|nr:tRNA (adenosine(37)-N6)-threonylcarbamoyltransferase complex transferase subunit TsaD [Patescibacteria group bacterium]